MGTVRRQERATCELLCFWQEADELTINDIKEDFWAIFVCCACDARLTDVHPIRRGLTFD